MSTASHAKPGMQTLVLVSLLSSLAGGLFASVASVTVASAWRSGGGQQSFEVTEAGFPGVGVSAGRRHLLQVREPLREQMQRLRGWGKTSPTAPPPARCRGTACPPLAPHLPPDPPFPPLQVPTSVLSYNAVTKELTITAKAIKLVSTAGGKVTVAKDVTLSTAAGGSVVVAPSAQPVKFTAVAGNSVDITKDGNIIRWVVGMRTGHVYRTAASVRYSLGYGAVWVCSA